ncbi:MAG: DegT/DnrJ/EryC1/StrS aminotransferase family protein [Acidimicrobiales bacterium]
MIGPQPIPFSPPSITDDDVAAVTEVLRSRWLSTGSVGHDLEAQLAERTGAPHVVAVASCTAALEICVRSLRLEPGTRVGVPTWTFVASANAISSVGAVPVLLDVEPDTLNVSAASVAAAIDAGIEALMVVHFAGAGVSAEVHDLAASAGIPVIEDAAHALGTVDHRGQVSGAGTVGACFSFYATKNLTSAEGGAIATHDPDLARFARSQRLHGLSTDAWDRYRIGGAPDYDVVEPGLKANLPDVLAALARSQLERFDQMQAHRRLVVERYRQRLAKLDVVALLRPDPGSADHLFVVLLPEGRARHEVVRALADEGIGTGVHFRPLHRFTWFDDHGEIGPSGVGTAERLAERALSLPLHAELSLDDVDRVVASLADVVS